MKLIKIIKNKNIFYNITIIVAVAVPCLPPPQHSPIFGHRASSQTVCKFKSRICSLIFEKFSPVGILVLSQGGKRNLSSSPLARNNFPLYALDVSGVSFIKSNKSGPL